MEKNSNGTVDHSHYDLIPMMQFLLDLPQIMGASDSRISSPGC